MRTQKINKHALYESIMKAVSKTVKQALNESTRYSTLCNKIYNNIEMMRGSFSDNAKTFIDYFFEYFWNNDEVLTKIGCRLLASYGYDKDINAERIDDEPSPLAKKLYGEAEADIIDDPECYEWSADLVRKMYDLSIYTEKYFVPNEVIAVILDGNNPLVPENELKEFATKYHCL